MGPGCSTERQYFANMDSLAASGCSKKKRQMDKGFEVEQVLRMRKGKKGTRQFLVRWRGYPDADSWEPEENFNFSPPQMMKVPLAAKSCGCSKKKSEMVEDFEVEQVLRVRRGSTGAKQFLVRWRGYPDSDTWEPEENLNFAPPELVKGHLPSVRASVDSAEWTVFSDQFLPILQYAVRFGWRRSGNLAGRVRRAARTWFPLAAVRRILTDSPHTLVRGEQMDSYEFAHPSHVPQLFVGPDSDEDPLWWRATKVVGYLPLGKGECENFQRHIVKGKVVFTYDPRIFRIAVSYNFVVCTRSEMSPQWTVLRGGDYEDYSS